MSIWNRIDQYGKRTGLRYLERLLTRPLITPRQINWKRVRRLLIVRQQDQLGDFLLSSPAWTALRRALPGVHIGMVARSYAADVVISNPAVDELLVFYENGLRWTPRRLADFARRLYHKWDMTVVLSSESHSLTSDLLAYFSGASYTLGSARKTFPGCQRNFFYNLIAPEGEPGKHQSPRNCEIVEYLGFPVSSLQEEIHITAEEKECIHRLYPDLYSSPGLVIGLHIGANKIENRWPLEKFAELAVRLERKKDLRLAIFWGPREKRLAREFRALSPEGRITFIPPTSLRNQAIHFSLCRAAVCNDTGVMHLCAAVGTPLVAAFGPTDPDHWKPLGDSFLALRAENGKTASIKVDAVLAGLEKLLSKEKR